LELTAASLEARHASQQKSQESLLQEIVDKQARAHELELILSGLQRQFARLGRCPPKASKLPSTTALPASKFNRTAAAPKAKAKSKPQPATAAKKKSGAAGPKTKKLGSIAAARKVLAVALPAKKTKPPKTKPLPATEPVQQPQLSLDPPVSPTHFFGQWLRLKRPSLADSTIHMYVKYATRYCEGGKKKMSSSSAIAAFKAFQTDSAAVKGASTVASSKAKASAKVKAWSKFAKPKAKLAKPKAKATAKARSMASSAGGSSLWQQAISQAAAEVPAHSEDAAKKRSTAAKRIYGLLRKQHVGGL